MARAYYSGDSADIDFILRTVRQRLPEARWHAVGVSLGGNAMLKHLGEQANEVSWLSACAAVSVPLDLVACGMRLSYSQLGTQLYSRYFLNTMKLQMQDTAMRFPANIVLLRITLLKCLRAFYVLYTPPLHFY